MILQAKILYNINTMLKLVAMLWVGSNCMLPRHLVSLGCLVLGMVGATVLTSAADGKGTGMFVFIVLFH